MSRAATMDRELELVATPGHVRAQRSVCRGETPIAPVFAQQFVRENTRTGRTPQPLIGDDWPSVPLVAGLQRFARFERILADTRLPTYLPQAHRK